MIYKIRNKIERKKGVRDRIEAEIKSVRREIKALEREQKATEEAIAIIYTVAQETQEQLRYRLCEITNLILSIVFDEPYEIDVQFEIKRGQTECKIILSKKWSDQEWQFSDLKNSSGYGVTDIIGFALRISLWSLLPEKKRSRAIFMLDEPLKHLKGESENKRILRAIRKICADLQIQIIMVSDERISRKEIAENADRCFVVNLNNGRSKVGVL
jgi:hypothetical protein